MTKFLVCILLLLTTFLFANCGGGNTSSSKHMVLDDIQYVRAFPQTFALDTATEVDLEYLDIIGVLDFRICDTLMIFSTKNDNKGFWSIMSLPNYHILGSFIKQGQGPYEFTHCPWVSKACFFRKKGELLAAIYYFEKGELYMVNISESLKNNQVNIYTLNDALPSFLFNFIAIDSTTFFCKEINNKETQQLRYVLSGSKKHIPAHFERLNQVSVREGEDFNILSTITKYAINKRLIVETPVVGLNYINIYSIDNSTFAKTICIGSQLSNIEKIQSEHYENRKYIFTDLRLFHKFWGVVHVNEDVKTYRTKRERLPEILLFDWNGVPLAKLQLKTFITSFDIDFINGYLYAFDIHTDMFYKYDIRNILSKLAT